MNAFLDMPTMLQWKATHPRIFKQHKLALMGQGKKKEHKIGYKGKEGESGKSWGRDVKMIKTCCANFSKD